MNRLAELRKEKKMTQTALALELNMTQNMISFYEKGKYQPSIETLKVFSKYFNVSVDYLIGNSNIRKKADAFEAASVAESEIMALFRNLNHDEQQRALGMLKAIKLL